MNSALIFPGQGSQYKNMDLNALKKYPELSQFVEEVNSILGYDIIDIIENGEYQTLAKTLYAQPCVLFVSYINYYDYAQNSPLPNVAIGHSLGEVSAYLSANAISPSVAFAFVKERSEIMNLALEMNLGKAGIITGKNLNRFEAFLADRSTENYVSVYNSSEQYVVVSKTQNDAKTLEEYAHNNNCDYIPFSMIAMKADAPYHSTLMKPLKNRIEEICGNIQLEDKMSFPIISTVSLESVTSTDRIATLLSSQFTTPVFFKHAILKAVEEGVEDFVDIGPGQMMMNLVLEEHPNLSFRCLG